MEVTTNKDDESTVVTMTSGTATIGYNDLSNTSQVLTLQAGKKLVFDNKAIQATISNAK